MRIICFYLCIYLLTYLFIYLFMYLLFVAFILPTATDRWVSVYVT